jgi:hypothetical protein
VQVEPGEVSSDKLSKKNMMTAVATHKQMLLGQKLRLEGYWIKHAKYGYQLQVPQSNSPTVLRSSQIISRLCGSTTLVNLPYI